LCFILNGTPHKLVFKRNSYENKKNINDDHEDTGEDAGPSTTQCEESECDDVNEKKDDHTAQ
jgi:hypothetical protein